MTTSSAPLAVAAMCCSFLCIASGCSRPDATPIAGSPHAVASLEPTKDAVKPSGGVPAASSSPTARTPSSAGVRDARRPSRAPVSSPGAGSTPGAQSASYDTSTPQDDDATATASSGASTYIVECVDDDLVSEPASLTLSCGDANEGLSGLTWVAWGSSRASASGMYVVNSCDPSCADGSPVSAPVHLTADTPARHGDQQFYSRIIVTFDATPPPGVDAVMTYALSH